MKRPKSAGIENSDLLQIAIVLGEVESIADNENVFDAESYIVQRYRLATTRLLLQEGGDPQRARTSRSEQFMDRIKGRSGVHNVFHEQNILSRNRHRKVLFDAYLAGRDRPLAVTGGGYELDFHQDRRIDAAYQVRDKNEAALQDSYHRQGAAFVIFGNFCPDFGDTPLDVSLGDQQGTGSRLHRGTSVPNL